MTHNTQGLDEILLQHRSEAFAISRGESSGKDIGTSADEAKQAILQWVNDEVITLDEVKSHLDHHFFDGKIPESLTTDKEQRAFGYGYNMRGEEQRNILRQHGWKESK